MTFSISIAVGGSDPTIGLLSLPERLASWLRIDNLAISIAASTAKKPVAA